MKIFYNFYFWKILTFELPLFINAYVDTNILENISLKNRLFAGTFFNVDRIFCNVTSNLYAHICETMYAYVYTMYMWHLCTHLQDSRMKSTFYIFVWIPFERYMTLHKLRFHNRTQHLVFKIGQRLTAAQNQSNISKITAVFLSHSTPADTLVIGPSALSASDLFAGLFKESYLKCIALYGNSKLYLYIIYECTYTTYFVVSKIHTYIYIYVGIVMYIGIYIYIGICI